MLRVLKPGGVASFLTITYPPSLSGPEVERAVELGNLEGVAGPGYENLMATAGFDNVSVIDVTPSYETTLRALTRAWRAESEAIESLIGREEFEERLERRRASLTGVAEGLHVRVWVTGRKPLRERSS